MTTLHELIHIYHYELYSIHFTTKIFFIAHSSTSMDRWSKF